MLALFNHSTTRCGNRSFKSRYVMSALNVHTLEENILIVVEKLRGEEKTS